jgi:hypothetical protein
MGSSKPWPEGQGGFLGADPAIDFRPAWGATERCIACRGGTLQHWQRQRRSARGPTGAVFQAVLTSFIFPDQSQGAISPQGARSRAGFRMFIAVPDATVQKYGSTPISGAQHLSHASA